MPQLQSTSVLIVVDVKMSKVCCKIFKLAWRTEKILAQLVPQNILKRSRGLLMLHLVPSEVNFAWQKWDALTVVSDVKAGKVECVIRKNATKTASGAIAAHEGIPRGYVKTASSCMSDMRRS